MQNINNHLQIYCFLANFNLGIEVLKMQKQDVTIYDVAREANVSMATVSRVVNGNTNVRKETRDKVLAVIDRLHYQPNAVAQGLASKKTTTVGVVVPGLTNLHFAELAKGIDDIATMYKYNIILTSIENNVIDNGNVIQSILNKQVDGVIYMCNTMSPKATEAFHRANIPVVLAGTIIDNDHFGSVAIDYKEADRKALELLWKDGKENIALIVDDKEAYINRGFRIKSYRQFLADHGIKSEYIYDNILTFEDGYNLFTKLHSDGIDAVVTTKDITAAGIVNAALDSQVSIPEQFEIISATSTNIAKIVRPQLTSIQQPLYDIGAVAMRMLTKLMKNEDVAEKNIVLPYQILKHNTTLNK